MLDHDYCCTKVKQEPQMIKESSKKPVKPQSSKNKPFKVEPHQNPLGFNSRLSASSQEREDEQRDYKAELTSLLSRIPREFLSLIDLRVVILSVNALIT